MAVNGVQGLTGSPEGLRVLAGQTKRLAPVLLCMVSDQPDISKAALSSLVNLSQVRAFSSTLFRSHKLPACCFWAHASDRPVEWAGCCIPAYRRRHPTCQTPGNLQPPSLPANA